MVMDKRLRKVMIMNNGNEIMKISIIPNYNYNY